MLELTKLKQFINKTLTISGENVRKKGRDPDDPYFSCLIGIVLTYGKLHGGAAELANQYLKECGRDNRTGDFVVNRGQRMNLTIGIR